MINEDDTYIVQKLEDIKIPDGYTLVSYDVVNMYTKICTFEISISSVST